MRKPLKTGRELRQGVRERLKKHRETMKKRGYKTVSIFMGEKLRAELKELSSALRITKYQALETIFDLYYKNVDNAKPDTETDTFSLGDYHGVNLTTKEKDQILIDLAEALPGRENAQRWVDILNNAGITCAGVAWTKKKFSDNWRFAKRRQEKK